MADSDSGKRGGVDCWMTDKKHQSGIALIMTLWGVALLSLLVASIVQTVRLKIQETQMWVAATEARIAAESAIHEEISRIAFGYAAPEKMRLDVSGDISVIVQDETGKIDLNTSSPTDMARLLAPVVGLSTAEMVADRIADWRDPDEIPRARGAESASYAAAGLPYTPRNNQFLHQDELYQVLGLEEELLRQLRPLTTVYSRRADIDKAVAPKPLNSKAHLPSLNAGYQLGRPYTIKATVQYSNASASANAVVVLTGRAADPYKVISWTWNTRDD